MFVKSILSFGKYDLKIKMEYTLKCVPVPSSCIYWAVCTEVQWANTCKRHSKLGGETKPPNTG